MPRKVHEGDCDLTREMRKICASCGGTMKAMRMLGRASRGTVSSLKGKI